MVSLRPPSFGTYVLNKSFSPRQPAAPPEWCLHNYSSMSQPPTLFTSVSNPHPIQIMCQKSLKDLSVCFHFCLVFTAWPSTCRGSKESKISLNMFHLSSSRKPPPTPAWGNMLHTGFIEVYRLQSNMYAHVVAFLLVLEHRKSAAPVQFFV